MPGKATQYAQGRSKQLVTNFAHDYDDERKLSTSMKYGQYIDPAEWGDTGEPFYQVNLGSAICGNAGAVDLSTADEVGKLVANSFKGSSGHWSYVGDADGDGYNYIAVGASCDKWSWYIDVEMARANIDNTGYYN